MTRATYLKQLKKNLPSLTTEEQNEAIQYYSDYFEEADDDEKVIAELGTPEELAKTIIEKMANVPVQTSKVNAEEQDDDDQSESSSSYDALYYEFDPADIKNISFRFGAAQVVAIPGNNFSIETRGITSDAMNCHLSPEGNLSIVNDKKVNLNFFSHDRKSRIIPRILITIPDNSKFNRLSIRIGAGSFETRDVDFSCKEGELEVGAGNLVIRKITGGQMNFRCGMGNLNFAGRITGVSNIDCGMGSIKLELEGNRDDYSYDVKVGLGDFRLNDDKKSGVCQVINDVRKDNHFSVNCGMGSVNIQINN